jgi:hypothetical protein
VLATAVVAAARVVGVSIAAEQGHRLLLSSMNVDMTISIHIDVRQ